MMAYEVHGSSYGVAYQSRRASAVHRSVTVVCQSGDDSVTVSIGPGLQVPVPRVTCQLSPPSLI